MGSHQGMQPNSLGMWLQAKLRHGTKLAQLYLTVTCYTLQPHALLAWASKPQLHVAESSVITDTLRKISSSKVENVSLEMCLSTIFAFMHPRLEKMFISREASPIFRPSLCIYTYKKR